MTCILAMRNPFQISNKIIAFVAVYMVNAWEILLIWNKSCSNQNVNAFVFVFSIFAKRYCNISGFMILFCECFFLSIVVVIQAFNITLIAYLL